MLVDPTLIENLIFREHNRDSPLPAINVKSVFIMSDPEIYIFFPPYILAQTFKMNINYNFESLCANLKMQFPCVCLDMNNVLYLEDDRP